MVGCVNEFNWLDAEAMRYWSYPKNYKKDYRAEIKNLIFSGEYYGALKVDGYYQRLVKDDEGNCFMIARSKNVKGEPVNKYEWVPQLHSFMESLPNGTVLLCECYIPKKEGSRNVTTLLGCTKDNCIARQEKGDKLHFYIFDVCTYNGTSYVDCGAAQRFEFLQELKTKHQHDFVKWAQYYNGKELWDIIGLYLEKGKEGAVITHKDCPIYFKRTPARQTIKIKKEISNTIDCFFTDRATAPTKEYTGKEIENWKYWAVIDTDEKLEIGDHYYEYTAGAGIIPVTKSWYLGFAGSLEIAVMKDGKEEPIGYLSNLTEEIKANFKDYKNKVIEVTAMEITDECRLRHGKLVQFRPDLTIEDCQWEKYFAK